jgi:hypothetical protein
MYYAVETDGRARRFTEINDMRNKETYLEAK